ncbi:MAG: CHAD domain-containing protein [Sulfuricurvum sp.]|nr:CHAD domain-containing protein [Sulfuricurvum sp.]
MKLSPLTKYLMYQLYQALLLVQKIGPEEEITHLHQFRVALRRVRSLLELYTPETIVFPQTLRTFFKTTNPLREFDIFLLSITPTSHKKVLKRLRSIRKHYYGEVISEGFKQRLIKALEEFYDFLVELNPAIEQKKLSQTAHEHYRTTLQSYRALPEKASKKELHALRIRFKVSHYALYFLNEIFQEKVTGKIHVCKQVQDKLGKIQDLYNQIKWLKQLYHEHPLSEIKTLLVERKKMLKKFKASS